LNATTTEDNVADQTDVLAQVKSLASRGALFVVNNSGGKDSQAMLIEVLRHVPRSQVLVIHASLGEAGTDPEGAEWPNTREHVAYMCDALDVPHVVCSAAKTPDPLGRRRSTGNAPRI
jgi:tRNA(Ile)-lysidine synthase TilS/MesJ